MVAGENSLEPAIWASFWVVTTQTAKGRMVRTHQAINLQQRLKAPTSQRIQGLHCQVLS